MTPFSETNSPPVALSLECIEILVERELVE
jgi:hypothetical protein